MPWALTTGHSQRYPRPEIADLFNGQGIGFFTTNVIEGKQPFHELWDYYNAWCTVTVKPAITSVESAVPDQIAYGYDYSPQRHAPASTWKFARDYYPYMRFGLALNADERRLLQPRAGRHGSRSPVPAAGAASSSPSLAARSNTGNPTT